MPFRVRNLTKDKLLATTADEARSFPTRFMGLMGRKDFAFGQGLHIVPCNGIHTFFMRIAIDALFLDRDLKVVKLFPSIPPWRMTSVYFTAHSVLELPSGTVAASGTTEGDQLELTTATSATTTSAANL